MRPWSSGSSRWDIHIWYPGYPLGYPPSGYPDFLRLVAVVSVTQRFTSLWIGKKLETFCQNLLWGNGVAGCHLLRQVSFAQTIRACTDAGGNGSWSQIPPFHPFSQVFDPFCKRWTKRDVFQKNSVSPLWSYFLCGFVDILWMRCFYISSSLKTNKLVK